MQSAQKLLPPSKRTEMPGTSGISVGSASNKGESGRPRSTASLEQNANNQKLFITVPTSETQEYVRKVQLESSNIVALNVPKTTKNKSALDSVEHLAPKALTLRVEFRRAQSSDKDVDKELREGKQKQPEVSPYEKQSRIKTIEEFVDRPRDPRIVAKIRESVATADESRLKQLLANFERVIAVHVACAALADEELMFGAMLDDADLQSLDGEDSGFSASPESRL